jgi:hypothetical protein
MKKTLSLSLAMMVSSGIFAQSLVNFQTDEQGKIYSSSSIQNSLSNQDMQTDGLILDWSEPDFNISNNPSLDSWDSRLTMGLNGVPYVVYSDNHSNGLQKIMFRKKVNNEWTAPIFVDAGGEIGGRNNHFGAIGYSPNGDLHVTFNVWAFENVRNYVGYAHYDAVEGTWSDAEKISDLNGTVNHFTTRHDIYSTEDNKPVVVWGYDFRANQTNEEIYMKYFDGTNWSSDIAVSDVTDNLNAGLPHIKSIRNNKGMILYAENVDATNMELRYRIYDETTHTLSPAKVVTTQNVGFSNYVLTVAGLEVKVLLLYKNGSQDNIEIYNYDSDTDSFTLSEHEFQIAANAGGLMKRADMDCMGIGECGIVFTDFLEETNTFVSFNDEEGFGEPVIINEQNPGFDTPNIRMDYLGNAHVVWSDYRFNDGEGWDEREVFYKMGATSLINVTDFSTSNFVIYPNPTSGQFTIDTKEAFKVEIFNALGKMVQTQNISGKTNIQTSLSTGVYFLKLSNEKGSHVRKLIIK